MNSTQNAAEARPQGPPVVAKKVYRPPTLTLFGEVATLTQSTGCSAASDSATSCTPGQMGGAMPSDRRLKQDIIRIGDHPAGFGLYLFSYLPDWRDQHGHGRQFGVMADEVAGVVPEAVTLHSDGFLRVSYDRLGIRKPLH